MFKGLNENYKAYERIEYYRENKLNQKANNNELFNKIFYMKMFM